MNAILERRSFHKAADPTEAEQAVIGAILLNNGAMDRIIHLDPTHFYHRDHSEIFAEMRRELDAGKTVDVVSMYEVLHARVPNCLKYLHDCALSTPGAAGIERHAKTVIDRAIKRRLAQIGDEMIELAQSAEPAEQLVDRAAGKLELLGQTQVREEPELFRDMLVSYTDLLEQRMAGIVKPVSTGFKDLDKALCGGLERETLTVVAGRPSMGKTAFGLALGRNMAEMASSTSLFLSLEMSRPQVCDRNIAALGRIPIMWLRNPTDSHSDYWDRMTNALARAEAMKMIIDVQTGLTMTQIRAKARSVKRKFGLDALILDQLSFITGGDAENKAYEYGEYTRGLLALSRELKIAVILLCQLNRECEKRPNKRPLLSDLASSGSIEQDADTILFLYRDEVYDRDTHDKGICEIGIGKARQGSTGIVPLAYIGEETRFENLDRAWEQKTPQARNRLSRFE